MRYNGWSFIHKPIRDETAQNLSDLGYQVQTRDGDEEWREWE